MNAATTSSMIITSRLEKALYDNGLDIVTRDGDWSVGASTQCDLRVRLVACEVGGFLVVIDERDPVQVDTYLEMYNLIAPAFRASYTGA